MKRIFGILLAALIVLGLVGCGNKTAQKHKKVVLHKLQNKVKPMHIGDKYVYAVDVMFVEPGKAQEVRGMQTLAIIGTVRTAQGVTAYVRQTELHEQTEAKAVRDKKVFKTRTAKTSEYMYQDATGTEFEYGGINEAGKEFFITEPKQGFFVFQPSPITVGTTFHQKSKDTGGGTTDMNFKVIGTETITTPAGEFECYKIESFGTNDGAEMKGMEWYAPQIGEDVRFAYSTRDKSGKHRSNTGLQLVNVMP
jgi:hypothetical protein